MPGWGAGAVEPGGERGAVGSQEEADSAPAPHQGCAQDQGGTSGHCGQTFRKRYRTYHFISVTDSKKIVRIRIRIRVQ